MRSWVGRSETEAESSTRPAYTFLQSDAKGTLTGRFSWAAWLCVAIALLSLRGNRWGYFLGISTAAFWNYLVLFVNSSFRSGRKQLQVWLSTGMLPRPDNFIAIPAFFIHLLMIAVCVQAYSRMRDRNWTDAGRFFVSVGASVGYFAAIVAILQPKYLPMFRLLSHPRFNY